MIQESLYTFIQTKTAVTDLIGTRFRPGFSLPQDREGLRDDDDPYCVYLFPSKKPVQHSTAEQRTMVASLLIKCYANAYVTTGGVVGAVNIADAIRQSLDTARGAFGSDYLSQCFLESEEEDTEGIEGGEFVAPFTVTQAYRIGYAVTIASP